MVLRLLETENFLSHESVSVAFPERGIFLLLGPSGSGKSSFIIDALAYALFGAVATRAKRQQDLLTKGKEEKMSVRLTFDFSPGRRITISRGLDERGASWAEVYEKETMLAEGSAPVAKFVRSELGGMVWQQFYAAFVARQSEIAMLTSLRGAERKNLVQRMLGMRELEKTSEIISENIRRYSAEVDQLESGFVDQSSLRQEEREVISMEIKDKKSELENVQTEIKAQEKTMEECALEMEPLQKAVAGNESRREILLQIEGLEKQESILGALRKYSLDPQDLPDLQKNLENLRVEQEDLRESYRRATEKEKLQEDLARIGPYNKDRRLSDLEEKLRSAKQSKKQLDENIDLFIKRGRDLEETGSCDLCLRPFASEEEKALVVAEIERELSATKQRASDLGEQIASWKNALPDWQSNEKKKQGAEKILFQIEDLGETEKSAVIAAKGKAIGQEIEDLERKIIACQMSAEGNFDRNELSSIKEEIRSLRKILPKEVPLENDPATLERKRSLAEGECKRLLGRRVEIEKQIASLQDSLQRHLAVEKETEQERNKIDRVRSRLILQSQLQDYLKGYQKHLAHEIRPALEEIGSEMMRRVSGGQHRAIHLDDNYEIELEKSSGERISAGMISGGEAVRASLCLRLALTRLVSSRTGVPVGFLVLDEPLPAQDAGHIERIMELLESLRPFYQQQFLISHVGNLAVSEEVDYLLQFGDEPPQLLRA